MTQHVNLTFSLKYLVNFSKSASLSDTVQLMLKNDVPLLVSILSNIARHIFLIPNSFSGVVHVWSGIHSVLSCTKDRGRLSVGIALLALAHILSRCNENIAFRSTVHCISFVTYILRSYKLTASCCSYFDARKPSRTRWGVRTAFLFRARRLETPWR